MPAKDQILKMTPEQLERRRVRNQEYMRKKRESMSAEQKEEERKRARKHMSALYKNMSLEAKRSFLDSLAEKRKYTESYRIDTMFHNALRRATRKGIEFTISKDDIVIPEYCPVLGIKLKCGDRDNYDASPSLDRIDNTKGYIKGNVTVISYRANNVKNNGTKEEHLAIAAWLEKVGVR